MKLKTSALAVLISMSASAYSEVDCTGTVTNLSIQLNSLGTITLSLSGGPSATYLCDIDGPNNRNGVTPAVCRAMYSTLMTAKTTGKKVLVRFYDYDTCTAIPAWANSGVLGWTQLLLD